LTQRLWSEFTPGVGREALVSRGGARQVGWRLKFRSNGAGSFAEDTGTLDLSSATRHCDELIVALACLPYSGEPYYLKLGQQSCTTDEVSASDCRMFTEAQDAEALVARFARVRSGGGLEFSPASSSQCESIRAQCVPDGEPGEPPVPSDRLKEGAWQRPVACSQADEAVQACREARRVEANRQAKECRGVLIATITPNERGVVELRVVGADRTVWASETIAVPAPILHRWGLVFTPITAVADIPAMVVLPVAIYISLLTWNPE